MGRPRKNPELGRILYVPTDTFTASVNGVDMDFIENQTTVEAGHPLLAKYPHLFKPLRAHYPVDRDVEPLVEQATSAPGEMRDLVA